MNNYSQSANPNATNSELDAKKIITNSGLTSTQKDELIEQYVNLIIDGMSMRDLIDYVSRDITDFCDKLTDNELKEEISLTMDEEIYDELVDNIVNTDSIVYNTNGGDYQWKLSMYLKYYHEKIQKPLLI